MTTAKGVPWMWLLLKSFNLLAKLSVKVNVYVFEL